MARTILAGLMLSFAATAMGADGQPVTATAPATAAIDRADHKAVALAWLGALKTMEPAELSRHIAKIDDKETAEYVDLTLRMASGKLRMRRLAAKLFPDDSALPKPRRYENVDAFIAGLEQTTPTVDESKAVYNVVQPGEGGAEMKIYLIKRDGRWWIDGPATVGMRAKPDAPEQVSKEMARQRARVECQDQIIKRAEAGEFKSYGEMEKAFFDLRRQAEEKLMPATQKKGE